MKITQWLCLVLAGALLTGQNVQAKPRPPLPPWPEQSLARESFDEPLYARASAQGNLTSDLSTSMDVSTYAESWSGYALTRQALAVSQWVMPMVGSNRWNIAPTTGTIRFWFKPDWSSVMAFGNGPGRYARLLEMVNTSQKEVSVRWSLYTSTDGNTLFLSRSSVDGMSDVLKADIAWQAGQWHMVSLAYDPTNTVLSIDGLHVALGTGFTAVQQSEASGCGLIVGSDFFGNQTAGGQFDELGTFQYFVTELQQAFYYSANIATAALGPVTAEEEAAVASMRALATSRTLTAQSSMMSLDGGGVLLNESVQEGLYLALTGMTATNVSLTLYGANTNAAYEIYMTTDLGLSMGSWSIAKIGTVGQTNFTAPRTNNYAFFRAAEGTDWDGDGIPNFMDADPSNGGVGALMIWIDSPADLENLD